MQRQTKYNRMKIKNWYLGGIAICCCLLLSCENNANQPDTPSEPPFPTGKEINVSLHISPSLEQEEEPLSRAASINPNGIYAVNVFWKGKGITSYQPYASGLFDDIANVNIGLIEGYYYRFDCGFLTATELPYCQHRQDTTYYGLPFSRSGKGDVDGYITNKLYVSIDHLNINNSFHQGIYKGKTQLTQNNQSIHPAHRRYYGSSELDFREKDASSLSVNLQLRPAYYKLQFTTDELAEGDSIKILSQDIEPCYLLYSPTGKSESEERQLCLAEIADTYDGRLKNEEDIPLYVYYRPADKEQWYTIFEGKSIQMQRYKKNIIRIVNIKHYVSDTNITFGEDETFTDHIIEIGE